MDSLIMNVTTLRSGLCYLSVVCLSLTFVRPILSGWNFRQSFSAILYLNHPLTSTQIFTEIVPGEPSVGGVKPLNARGVAK